MPAQPLEQAERERQALAVLCDEHTRAMLAQNAATLGRLAAAVTHEMNTPLGALRSAADTLLSLDRRGAQADHVREDLLRTIRDSTTRLASVVARLQRFTNLNRAEVQEMCLNGLLSDAASLISERGRIGLDLESRLPYVLGHPQQLSAVLLAILNNAVESGGEVRAATRSSPAWVHVDISDNGRGMTPEQVAEAMEPVLQERDGRMAAGNWNLFSCRHIVEAHGGRISIDSAPGRGTTVHIALKSAATAAHA
jgi:signal transduction histidine kinase